MLSSKSPNAMSASTWIRFATYYLPLYVFCGDHLLCARLRSSNRGAAHGVVPELKRIVRRLREAWPQVRITVRGDSGFSNDELMAWCEEEGIDYVLGLAKNDRLKRRMRPQCKSSGSCSRRAERR